MFSLVCLQLIFPDQVEGLVLLNIDPNGKGWIDWAASKVLFFHPNIHVFRSYNLFCNMSFLFPSAVRADQQHPRYRAATSFQPGKITELRFYFTPEII